MISKRFTEREVPKNSINQYHFGEIEGVVIAGTKINAKTKTKTR